jgi:hypothetical protein
VQRQVEGEHRTAPNQGGGPLGALVGQQVQRAELVVLAPRPQEEPGGASGRTGSWR